MPKKRRRAKASKYSDRIIIAVAAAFMTSAALLAVFSVAITKGILDFDASNVIVKIVNLISAMVCGFVVSLKGEGNIIKCGIVPGIIFGFIIAVASLAVNIEAFSATEALKILLISVAGSTLGSILILCRSNKKCHK